MSTTKQRQQQKQLKNPNQEFFSNLNNQNHALALSTISPKTPNQEMMFKEFSEGHNLFVYGYAGTGKTLLSLYLGLTDVMSSETSRDNIIILRSVVPSRDMGFLPGSSKEKAKVYELPYQDVCNELFSKPNSYEALKAQKVVYFTTTSYLRGITFRNSVVYIDEIQNMADTEIQTIMTRIGEGCRIIVSGDLRQSDLFRENEKGGYGIFARTVQKMPSFRSIEFTSEDILRSSFVKEYILARESVLNPVVVEE